MPSKLKLPDHRQLHLAVCIGLLLFVSWGLLSTDPLAVVKHTPLSVLAKISDVIVHCGVYTIFSLACCSLTTGRHDARPHRMIVGLLAIHGIGTELLQGYIPRRTPDPLDGLANMVGILLGVTASGWLVSRRLKRSPVRG